MRGLVFRIAIIGAAFVAMIVVVNQDRGLPLVVCIVFALALAFAYRHRAHALRPPRLRRRRQR